nr:hypothetical protein [Mesorhizobium sp.]
MDGCQATRLIVAEDRKGIAFSQIIAAGECLCLQRLTVQAAKPDLYIVRTRRHTPVARMDFKQATCRKAGAARQHLQASDGDNLLPCQRLAQTHRIGVNRPKIQGPRHRRQIFRGSIPAQNTCRIWPLAAGKIAPVFQWHWTGSELAPRQATQQLAEALDGGFIAFEVQGQRRFGRRNQHLALNRYITWIKPIIDIIPGDGMLALLRQQRPRRSVSSGVARQGTVMTVESTLTDPSQHIGRQDERIGNGKEPLHRLDLEEARQLFNA